jgi:hypothetical protein
MIGAYNISKKPGTYTMADIGQKLIALEGSDKGPEINWDDYPLHDVHVPAIYMYLRSYAQAKARSGSCALRRKI